MPRDAVSRTANVERTARLITMKILLSLHFQMIWGTFGGEATRQKKLTKKVLKKKMSTNFFFQKKIFL